MSDSPSSTAARAGDSVAEQNAPLDAELAAELDSELEDELEDYLNGEIENEAAAQLYDSDDGEDHEEGTSKLGRHDYWESVYAKERRNLKAHGDLGEIWFGEDVLEAMLDFISTLVKSAPQLALDMPILDLGTGNGVLPIQLAKRGFGNVTGSDYSRAAVDLCADVASAEGVEGVTFVLDDVLQSTLPDRFTLITDKGTLDAIGLSSGRVQNRRRYRQAVWDLLTPGGLLVITSCNSTKDELVTEFCDVLEQLSRLSNPLADCKEAAQQVPPSQTANSRPACGEEDAADEESAAHESGSQEEGLLGGLEEQQGVGDQGRRLWEYVDHVRTYPVFRFGGVEGTRVATVAFRRVG